MEIIPIPVTERLPAPDHRVIFWSRGCFCVGYKAEDDEGDRRWLDELSGRDDEPGDEYEVTHWAEIPAAPQP